MSASISSRLSRNIKKLSELAKVLPSVLLVSAATNVAANETTKLVYSGWGGIFEAAERQAWLEPFEKENPDIKVIYAVGNQFAKLKAMTEAKRPTWDIFTGDYFGSEHEKYFERLDCNQIPCSEIMPSSNITPYNTIYYNYAFVITYNKSRFQNDPPKTMKDVLDGKKYPGKRAFYGIGESLQPIYIGLLGDGVDPKKMFPLDVDRALRALEPIKNDIIYYQTPNQCSESINNGTAVIGICLVSRNLAAIEDGSKDIGMSWETPIISSGSVAIVKDAPNAKAAQRLLAYILDSKNNARLSEHVPYSPTNKNAFGKVADKFKGNLPTDHYDKPYLEVDWKYIGSHGMKDFNKFYKWRQSR